MDEPATPLSPVREQRSLLPPIQEAPSDRGNEIILIYIYGDMKSVF